MQKLTALVGLLILAIVGGSLGLVGCSSGPAEGKLQIMYSGNIRGNVAPCG
ncbi:hypothetical protein IT157_01125 [bacterium]|nr:hypothetical protein [bacterium]